MIGALGSLRPPPTSAASSGHITRISPATLFTMWGGWKCPEEEHTTCSGGPTINCHKRGLRGERK
jgi:hypothetical protein